MIVNLRGVLAWSYCVPFVCSLVQIATPYSDSLTMNQLGWKYTIKTCFCSINWYLYLECLNHVRLLFRSQESKTPSLLSAFNFLFHCHPHTQSFSRSLFTAVSLEFYTTRKTDVSSANSLTQLSTCTVRSLIEISKIEGPRIEPCRKPADTVPHSELCPFNTTRCLWS